MSTPPTITPLFVADLLAETERMPLSVHLIDHPDARVLVDTGMTELHRVEPGVRLVPAPGHTRGMQVVVVETGGRLLVVGGDVAVWFGELDEPTTEGQLLVRALEPELVWLAHEREPWRPPTIDPLD